MKLRSLCYRLIGSSILICSLSQAAEAAPARSKTSETTEDFRRLHLLYQVSGGENLVQFRLSREKLEYHAGENTTSLAGNIQVLDTITDYTITQGHLAYERGITDNFSVLGGMTYRSYGLDYTNSTSRQFQSNSTFSQSYSSTFEGLYSFDVAPKARGKKEGYEFYASLPFTYVVPNFDLTANSVLGSYELNKMTLQPTVGIARPTSYGTPGLRMSYQHRTQREINVSNTNTVYRLSGGHRYRFDLFYDFAEMAGVFATLQGARPIQVTTSSNKGQSFGSTNTTIHEVNSWGLGAYGHISVFRELVITPEFSWLFRRQGRVDGLELSDFRNYTTALTARYLF